MKDLKSQGDESCTSDPYYEVITKKEHSWRLWLHGRGITPSSLKKKDNASYVVWCGMLWCGGVVWLDVIRVGKSPRAVVCCELC